MSRTTQTNARRRRFRKLAGLLLGTMTSLLLVCTGGPAHAAAGVSLPADESPHVSAGMEWWYITGHLSGKDLAGKTHSYGFETLINRVDGLSTAPVATIYNGNFAIADLTRGTYTSTKSLYSISPDSVPAGGGFSVNAGSIHIDGKNLVNHFSGGFSDLSYVFGTMTASQTQPAALHGNAGTIGYGPFGTSGYYSETNLHVSGTLFDHGSPVTVTGTAWLDHQWGNWTPGQGGWEWYSLQLSNNTQYMLYFIRDANGHYVQTIGTRVNADGTTTNLPAAQLSRATTSTWKSPDTGITYPVASTVNVPGGTLSVTPQLVNQEVWSSLIPQGNYWEGTSTVAGTVNGQAVTGQAYAEVIPFIDMPGHGYVWQSVKDLLGL